MMKLMDVLKCNCGNIEVNFTTMNSKGKPHRERVRAEACTDYQREKLIGILKRFIPEVEEKAVWAMSAMLEFDDDQNPTCYLAIDLGRVDC